MQLQEGQKIPVTIVSGFLGSGKTTIINHLIEELLTNNIVPVIIKNEIGDVDIDTTLFKGQNIQVAELLGGCICCTLVGPFMHAINELIEKFTFHRIIIESSGAADPSSIALSVSAHPKLVRDGVIEIVDVVNFKGYEDLSETLKAQTQFTDLIIFNKVELVDIDTKRAVVGYVRELNSKAPIIEAPHGIVPMDLVFGVTTDELNNELLKIKDVELEYNHEDHIEHDEFSAFHIEYEGRISRSGFEEFINKLPSAIFRCKGYITFITGETYLFNVIGKRLTLDKAKEDFNKNILVFIGYRAKELKEQVSVFFNELIV